MARWKGCHMVKTWLHNAVGNARENRSWAKMKTKPAVTENNSLWVVTYEHEADSDSYKVRLTTYNPHASFGSKSFKFCDITRHYWLFLLPLLKSVSFALWLLPTTLCSILYCPINSSHIPNFLSINFPLPLLSQLSHSNK